MVVLPFADLVPPVASAVALKSFWFRILFASLLTLGGLFLIAPKVRWQLGPWAGRPAQILGMWFLLAPPLALGIGKLVRYALDAEVPRPMAGLTPVHETLRACNTALNYQLVILVCLSLGAAFEIWRRSGHEALPGVLRLVIVVLFGATIGAPVAAMYSGVFDRVSEPGTFIPLGGEAVEYLDRVATRVEIHEPTFESYWEYSTGVSFNLNPMFQYHGQWDVRWKKSEPWRDVREAVPPSGKGAAEITEILNKLGEINRRAAAKGQR